MCDDLILAAKYLPKERLGSTDDCGFSTRQYRARTEAWVAGCGATSFQTLELRVDGPELRHCVGKAGHLNVTGARGPTSKRGAREAAS